MLLGLSEMDIKEEDRGLRPNEVWKGIKIIQVINNQSY